MSDGGDEGYFTRTWGGQPPQGMYPQSQQLQQGHRIVRIDPDSPQQTIHLAPKGRGRGFHITVHSGTPAAQTPGSPTVSATPSGPSEYGTMPEVRRVMRSVADMGRSNSDGIRSYPVYRSVPQPTSSPQSESESPPGSVRRIPIIRGTSRVAAPSSDNPMQVWRVHSDPYRRINLGRPVQLRNFEDFLKAYFGALPQRRQSAGVAPRESTPPSPDSQRLVFRFQEAPSTPDKHRVVYHFKPGSQSQSGDYHLYPTPADPNTKGTYNFQDSPAPHERTYPTIDRNRGMYSFQDMPREEVTPHVYQTFPRTTPPKQTRVVTTTEEHTKDLGNGRKHRVRVTREESIEEPPATPAPSSKQIGASTGRFLTPPDKRNLFNKVRLRFGTIGHLDQSESEDDRDTYYFEDFDDLVDNMKCVGPTAPPTPHEPCDCQYTCHHKCRQQVALDCANVAAEGKNAERPSRHHSETSLGGTQSQADDADSGYHTANSTLLSKNAQASKAQGQTKVIAPSQGTLTREDLRRRIEAFNNNSHGLIMTLDHNSSTFQGFIRVHMNLIRPINMSLTVRPPSIYEVLTHEEPSGQTEESQIASFYLPKDTTKVIHINSDTTAQEVIRALLTKFRITDNPRKFALYEKIEQTGEKATMRRLGDMETPLHLCLGWTASGLAHKKFVLQENEPGEIMWEAFSMPELENFLKILDREEAEYVEQIKAKYVLFRIQLERRRKELEKEREEKKEPQQSKREPVYV